MRTASSLSTKTPFRLDGFTVIEVVVSLAVFAIVVVSVLSVAAETSSFIGNTDIDYNVQANANRAYTRLSNVLRKSGWNETGGTTYPQIAEGGAELRFRLLADLDGNGYAFDATTGDLEWGATIYSVRLDSTTGTLSIHDGAAPVHVLGRHVQSVSFATYNEDPALHLKEIRLTLQTEQTTREGHVIRYDTTSSIHMRN